MNRRQLVLDDKLHVCRRALREFKEPHRHWGRLEKNLHLDGLFGASPAAFRFVEAIRAVTNVASKIPRRDQAYSILSIN